MFHCWWNLLCRSMMSGRKWRTWSKSCNNRCKTFLRPTLGSRFSGCMAMDVKNWWSFIRNLHEFANRYLGNTQTYSMLWWHELCSLGCLLEAGGDVLMMKVMFLLEISVTCCQYHPISIGHEVPRCGFIHSFPGGGSLKSPSQHLREYQEGFWLQIGSLQKKLCYFIFLIHSVYIYSFHWIQASTFHWKTRSAEGALAWITIGDGWHGGRHFAPTVSGGATTGGSLNNNLGI